LKFLCGGCVGRRVSKVPTDCDFKAASCPDANGNPGAQRDLQEAVSRPEANR